ncbi:MAG: MarR family winged helix-turn-helix transcriptional regulator [Capsulimonadaceae bacterium]
MNSRALSFFFANKAELLKNLSQRYRGFDPEMGELVASLQGIARSLDVIRQEHLECHGLSQGKLYVLAFLINEEMMRRDEPGPTEIAMGLGVTPATVTGLLDGLERDGFVERRRHPQDRRALTIRLTDRSRRFLDEYMPQQARRYSSWLGVLNSDERRALAELLGKIDAAHRETDPPGSQPSHHETATHRG